MKQAELLEELMKCNRCASCHDVCPTYKISGNEFAVARGRLRLLRLGLENQLDLDKEPELEIFANECLLCKACEVNCPSNVHTTKIISEIKAYFTRKKGLPLIKRIMYRGFFSNPKRLNLARKMARIYQWSGAERVLNHADILKDANNLIPDMPRLSLREQLPGILKEMPEAAHKVAYFLGCSVNQFFSQVGMSTLKVLQANNCAVTVPDVNCCGAPHQSAGDIEEYKKLTRYNLNILAKLEVEAIVVDCATCGAIIKEYEELFEDELEYKKMAQSVKEKILDISTYLLTINYKSGERDIPLKVTYHDPCHGIRGLNVNKAPRTILKSIHGLQFIEMKEADMCCGGAGSYGIFHPEMSKKILERKIKNFTEANASVLVTSCPACMMQLNYGMKTHGISGQVKHLSELLAESYNI